MRSVSTGSPISSKPRCLLSIDDLADGEIDGLLASARALLAGEAVPALAAPFTAGLLFLSSSLRTRVGFSVASARLGGQAIEVVNIRWQPGMSEPEPFLDSLRVVSGMVDVVVVRVPFALEAEAVSSSCVAPLVNAGDGVEHPTQALVDLLAIEEERGPVEDLYVGVCGDLTGRSARSLLKLLARRTPRRLRLMAPPGRYSPAVLPEGPLGERTVVLDQADFTDLDVLYLAGLAEGTGLERIAATRRAEFALTPKRVGELPEDAVVLSPLPLIDEVAEGARGDPRIRWLAQSDRGVAVRMAVLRLLLQSTQLQG